MKKMLKKVVLMKLAVLCGFSCELGARTTVTDDRCPIQGSGTAGRRQSIDRNKKVDDIFSRRVVQELNSGFFEKVNTDWMLDDLRPFISNNSTQYVPVLALPTFITVWMGNTKDLYDCDATVSTVPATWDGKLDAKYVLWRGQVKELQKAEVTIDLVTLEKIQATYSALCDLLDKKAAKQGAMGTLVESQRLQNARKLLTAVEKHHANCNRSVAACDRSVAACDRSVAACDRLLELTDLQLQVIQILKITLDMEADAALGLVWGLVS